MGVEADVVQKFSPLHLLDSSSRLYIEGHGSGGAPIIIDERGYVLNAPQFAAIMSKLLTNPSLKVNKPPYLRISLVMCKSAHAGVHESSFANLLQMELANSIISLLRSWGAH